jgi:hypothetical protein
MWVRKGMIDECGVLSKPCETLDYIISNKNLYTIQIIDITTCSSSILFSENQATVICGTDFSFTFEYNNVEFENIKFVLPITPSNSNLFDFTSNFTIKNCLFEPELEMITLSGSLFSCITQHREFIVENSSFFNIHSHMLVLLMFVSQNNLIIPLVLIFALFI